MLVTLENIEPPQKWGEKAQFAAQLPAQLPRTRYTHKVAGTAHNCSGFACGMSIHVVQGAIVSKI